MPTRAARALDIKEGRLVEVKKAKKQVDKRVVWRDCLWKARHHNLKVGAAAHMYKKKTGKWPRGMELQPRGAEWQMMARDFLERRRDAIG